MSICTIKTAAEALRACIEADIPAMLWGPPGVGKSEVVYQVGAEMKRAVKDFRPNRMDPVDLHGLPIPDLKSKTTLWLPPAALPDAKRDGEFGILFIDELNTASIAMQAACFGLILERRLGEYELPPGWVPVAAGNRVSDRAAAQRMPTALRNRFAHFEVEADVPTWCDWAMKNGVDPIVVAFIKFRHGTQTSLLHVMPPGEENAFPTPRAWVKVAKVISKLQRPVRQTVVAGLVGDGAAAEIEGFLRVYSDMPDLDAIENGGHANAKMPREPAALYAVSQALARRATRKNFANIIAYTDRMPSREFQVMTVIDAVKCDEKLKTTAGFTAWAVNNQDVMN